MESIYLYKRSENLNGYLAEEVADILAEFFHTEKSDSQQIVGCCPILCV